MKKKITHYLEYILIKFLYSIILNLPNAIVQLFARIGSFIFEHLLHYRSHVIDVNLSIAFPKKSLNERQKIKHDFYKHLILFFLEFIKGPRITDKFLNENLINESQETLEKFRGKPFLLVTAHYGEFNLFLMKVTQFIDTHLHIIMKKQKNPYANEFMVEQRKACNQVPHISKGSLRTTTRALRNKEYLGFLNDQKAGKDGLNVTFFGKTAPTMIGLAFMKEKFDYPILQGYCCREKNGKYRFWLDEVKVERLENEKKHDYFTRILQASNDHLEKAIHRYPDQYLWSHKRWKVSYKT